MALNEIEIMNYYDRIKIKNAMAKWLDDIIGPDFFITVTFKQAMTNSHGGVCWGNYEIYSAQLCKFLKRLSKKCYGKASYQRTKRRIPGFATLENGFQGEKRWHSHICLKKPDRLTNEVFEKLINEVWIGMEWSMKNIDVLEIERGAVYYSIKEGIDAIVIETISE